MDGAGERWDAFLHNDREKISLRTLQMEIIELENAEFREITDERMSLSAYCKTKNLSRILDNQVIHWNNTWIVIWKYLQCQVVNIIFSKLC